jgi:hypothetical protein
MNTSTPLVKGLITGTAMITSNLLLINFSQGESKVGQYLFYALYAGGIAWTLIAYSRSENYVARFGSLFGQGFRCFIIITLIAVIFTGVYSATHPELAREAAENYRTEMKKDPGSKTPADIEEDVKKIKSGFVTFNIYTALFGSLITGVIFTAVGSGLLLLRRK